VTDLGPAAAGDWDALRERLDRGHVWPHDYTFKFIVPVDRLSELESLWSDVPFRTRASRGGRYVSLTAVFRAASADEVVERYRQAAKIPDLLAL